MATEYKLSYTGSEIDAKLGKIDSLAEKSEIPTNISQLNNDSGFITSYTETDPTVPAWAKASTKPTYTASEVGADASGTAKSLISAHNTAADAHADIRTELNNKLSSSELQTAIDTSLAQAKASGEFDGATGKTAYAYAQDGGYTGTEEEFAAKLAEETPKAFYVTVTQNGTGYTVDKTITEIESAYQAGKPLYCYCTSPVDGMTYCLPLGARLYSGSVFCFGNASVEGVMTVIVQASSVRVTAGVIPAKTSQLENDSDYASRSELPRAFYVTFSDDSVDKTNAEIYEAYQAGKSLYLVLNNWDGIMIPCSYCDEDIAAFFGLYENILFMVFDEDNAVDYFELPLALRGEIPTALPNPNALTINGTTYDGSSAVDMTEKVNALIDAKLSAITNAEEVPF